MLGLLFCLKIYDRMLSKVTQHPDIIIKSEEKFNFMIIKDQFEDKFDSPKAFKPSEILSKIYRKTVGSNVDRNLIWSWAKHSNNI